MAEIVRSSNNTTGPKDEHGVVLGYQELPSPPAPEFKHEANPMTPNQGGSRWVFGGQSATYICACGCTTQIPVGVFTKFPLIAKCCKNALPLERQ